MFAKGFRPFFLLAAVHAVFFVPVWVAVHVGHAPGVTGAWPPPFWHAHEMISGFALAVVAGFLLTAVENWTKRATARGPALAALAALWVLGRVGFFVGTAGGPPWLQGLDALFPVGLALAIGRPLWRTRNTRNALFPVALLVYAVAEARLHLEPDGPATAATARAALTTALDVVLVFVALVTGRIVPLFTRNATGAARIEDGKPTGRWGVAALALVTLAHPLGAPPWLSGALLGVAVLALGLRARRWGLRPALGTPLLWVLHLGHAWLLLALALRLGWQAAPSLVPRSAWVHAAGAGAIGLLTLGMMARVALGHTGRPLVAPRGMPAAFALVALGAVLRLVAVWSPGLAGPALWAAATCWSFAFAAYLVRYASILVRPRVDGRPG